ncbi:MAG: hypothetical protein LBB85_05850 [Dysgonamonadaceae bacterium]|nr:hypothetical protein [Dysgonamonadaceae bacterium]
MSALLTKEKADIDYGYPMGERSPYGLHRRRQSTTITLGFIALSLHGRLPILNLKASFAIQLAPGKSDNLKIDFKLVSIAGSNIYWDSNTNKLTFDESGVTTKGKSGSDILFMAAMTYRGVIFPASGSAATLMAD